MTKKFDEDKLLEAFDNWYSNLNYSERLAIRDGEIEFVWLEAIDWFKKEAGVK